ncbi:MAG: hypothetical protein WBP81_05480 [Solirubrobacteraceae bacterium]
MDVVSFAAEVADRPRVLDPVEHDCCAWCTFETALEMLDWPAEAGVLAERRAVLERLRARRNLSTG